MLFFEGPKGPVAYQYHPTQDRPTLLLLNGIMMSMDSWMPFIQPLSEHVSLLLVDFYDQGKSTHLSENYTQALQVEVLKGLLDHLNLKEVHVAGISYGASVAFQFTAQYPHHVASLMIFNGVMKTHEALKKIGDHWNQVAATLDGEAYYQATIPMIYSDYFKTHQKAWMASRKNILTEVFSNPAFLNRMVRLTQSAETHDVSEALANFKMPVLVVASDDDSLTPQEEQVAIVNEIPHAEMITFYQTGHASMYERPALFLSTIIGFMASQNYSITL